jgi:hypothetical protein
VGDFKMKPNFDWLINKRLSQVEKKDYTWFFTFENGGSVSIDSSWRLISTTGIIVTSEDHGQPFGLSAPVDAGEKVMTTVGNKLVVQCLCSAPTSDLTIIFEAEIQIQFLNMSSGYESWTMCNDNVQTICLGGGELASF